MFFNYFTHTIVLASLMVCWTHHTQTMDWDGKKWYMGDLNYFKHLERRIVFHREYNQLLEYLKFSLILDRLLKEYFLAIVKPSKEDIRSLAVTEIRITIEEIHYAGALMRKNEDYPMSTRILGCRLEDAVRAFYNFLASEQPYTFSPHQTSVLKFYDIAIDSTTINHRIAKALIEEHGSEKWLGSNLLSLRFPDKN